MRWYQSQAINKIRRLSSGNTVAALSSDRETVMKNSQVCVRKFAVWLAPDQPLSSDRG